MGRILRHEAWGCGKQWDGCTSTGHCVPDLQPGDEVIMPTYTIISCALQLFITRSSGRQLFRSKDVYAMSGRSRQRLLTERGQLCRCIYLHPVDMDEVIRLAQKYKLAIIEDAAEGMARNIRENAVEDSGI